LSVCVARKMICSTCDHHVLREREKDGEARGGRGEAEERRNRE